jgi:hypothetical protein
MVGGELMSTLKVNRIEPRTGDTVEIVGFGGEGSIIQTVLGTCSEFMTTNSTDWIETGLEATITPTKTSSKILVTWNIQVSFSNNNGFGVGLNRNGQEVWGYWYNGASYGNGIDDLYLYQGPYIFIDEPNTTDSLNYQTLVSQHYLPSGPIKLNGYGDEEQYKVETQILLQEIAG